MRLIDEKILARKREEERENEKVITTINETSDDSSKEKGITGAVIEIVESEEDEVNASINSIINKKILARKMKKERENEKITLTDDAKQNSLKEKSVSEDVLEIIEFLDAEDDKNKNASRKINTKILARKVKKERENEKYLADKTLDDSLKKKSITAAVIEIVESEEDENKTGKEKEMSEMDAAPRKPSKTSRNFINFHSKHFHSDI